LQITERTPHSMSATIKYMSLDLCCFYIVMAKLFLHSSDVCARSK
jgi:hypothetical protein